MWLVASVLGDVFSFYHKGKRRKLSNLDDVIELIDGLFQYAALFVYIKGWLFVFFFFPFSRTLQNAVKKNKSIMSFITLEVILMWAHVRFFFLQTYCNKI